MSLAYGSGTEGWEQPQFDDRQWSETQTPLLATERLCARRAFTLKFVPPNVALRVEGWAEFTVWINGRSVQTISNGRTESYTPVSLVLLSNAARATLHAGQNVIAIETNPSVGKMRKRTKLGAADSLDFGLIEVVE